LAGRLGGEEFAVLLAGSDTDEALHLAQRIRSAFRNNAQFLDGILIEATVSVGVATSPPHGSNLVDLIMSADRALYSAKRQGRDRVAVAARDLSDSCTSNVVQMVGEK
jgi:diguanylate cyclase (GGDEF)-like protein